VLLAFCFLKVLSWREQQSIWVAFAEPAHDQRSGIFSWFPSLAVEDAWVVCFRKQFTPTQTSFQVAKPSYVGIKRNSFFMSE
jgi:hypothetical protein